MSNEKGFTLVEVIAVVIIIAVIMLIAVPSYSEYVASSRKSAYISDVKAYVESTKSGAYSKLYGSLPEKGEILVVPYTSIKLEKNTNDKSPYAPYVKEKSYIVIVPRSTKGANVSLVYDYYVIFIDQQNNGIDNIVSTKLDRKSVVTIANPANVATIAELKNGSKKLIYDGITYKFTSDRTNAILMSKV